LEHVRTPWAIILYRDQINIIINNPNNHLNLNDTDVKDLLDVFEKNAEARLVEIGSSTDTPRVDTWTQDTTRIAPWVNGTQGTGDTPRVPQAEIVNTDIEVAQKRAMNALRAAEIEVVINFDDPEVIKEKMALIHWRLRTKANDIPFLQRTVDFRASFAGSLEIPEIRSMQAIGNELWRFRRLAPDNASLYSSSQTLHDHIRATTDPSALKAIGDSIRNLRISR
jgi:hypothetical protein